MLRAIALGYRSGAVAGLVLAVAGALPGCAGGTNPAGNPSSSSSALPTDRALTPNVGSVGPTAEKSPVTTSKLASQVAAPASLAGRASLAGASAMNCAVMEQGQAAQCRDLLEVERCLSAGNVALAEQQLVALGDGDPLQAQAQKELPKVLDELGWLRVLILGRTLLLKGSLSYGAGDEQNVAARLLFERLPRAQAPAAYADRLTLDLARSYLSLGEGEKAVSLLTELRARFADDAEVQAAYGIALLSLGRVEESLAPLSRAQALEPNEPERHLVLGTAKMLVGDLEGAERSFRGALQVAAKNVQSESHTNDVLARAYGDLGAVVLVSGRAEEGRSYLLRAVGLQPKRATYLSNLAYAEWLLGHSEQAKKYAESALRFDVRLASAWINLGLAQVKLQQVAEAKKSFTRAQELDPSDPRPQQNLADLEQLNTTTSQ